MASARVASSATPSTPLQIELYGTRLAFAWRYQADRDAPAYDLALFKSAWCDWKLGETDRWEIFTHGGRNPTGLNAVDYAREVVSLGAGEILLTSMDRDGTRSGFDIALTRAVADAVPVPVIASGGVGNLDHLVAGIRDGHATAVLAASIFHFGEFTVRQAKSHMARAGLPMRLDP